MCPRNVGSAMLLCACVILVWHVCRSARCQTHKDVIKENSFRVLVMCPCSVWSAMLPQCVRALFLVWHV